MARQTGWINSANSGPDGQAGDVEWHRCDRTEKRAAADRNDGALQAANTMLRSAIVNGARTS